MFASLAFPDPPMCLRLLVVPFVVLAAAGCATVGNVAAGGCPKEWRPLVLGQVLELEPGETRTLPRPRVMDGPFGDVDLPGRCGVRWSVRGRGVKVDGRGRLTVARDAAPGDTFQVLALAAGVWMRADGFVVDPAPNPLAGQWSQRDRAQCEEGAPPPPGRIGELIFQRHGRYWVTEQPFERVYGPSGTYHYDRAAGRLVLDPPTPGRPGEEYRVSFNQAGDLVVDPVNPGLLGQPRCRSVFQRVK